MVPAWIKTSATVFHGGNAVAELKRHVLRGGLFSPKLVFHGGNAVAELKPF